MGFGWYHYLANQDIDRHIARVFLEQPPLMSEDWGSKASRQDRSRCCILNEVSYFNSSTYRIGVLLNALYNVAISRSSRICRRSGRRIQYWSPPRAPRNEDGQSTMFYMLEPDGLPAGPNR